MTIATWVLLTMLIVGVESDIQLDCGTVGPLCLTIPVQYRQCIVNDSIILAWRIKDETMTTLDIRTYSNAVSISSFIPFTNAPDFSTDLSSTSPSIISNISFTVQSSINGYTILCEDLGGDSKNCTINVADIPDSPSNVTIHTDTFTNSSVNITWTESSSPCVTNYRYNVSSTTIDSTTTSNNVVLEGLVLSDVVYCIEVATVDTANRTNSSDPVCFVFNVPSAVDMLNVAQSVDVYTCTSIQVEIEWDEIQFDVLSDVIVPPLIGYRVSIVNATDPNDYSDVSPLLTPGTTRYTITGVPTGKTYNVTIIAINSIGESSPANVELVAPGTYVGLMLSPSSTITMTTTPSSDISPTNTGLSSSVSAGISVAITVPVTATITAIITIIIMYIVYSKHNKQQYNTTTSGILSEYETPIKTTELEMKTNKAYGQIQHNQTNRPLTTIESSMYETVVP